MLLKGLRIGYVLVFAMPSSNLNEKFGSIGWAEANPYKKNGEVLVSKIKSCDDLKATISSAVALIGGFQKIVEKGDEFLIKPNFNSSNPPPASSDPEFIKAVIELLYKHGARDE